MKKIKNLLIRNGFDWIVENQKAWRAWRKSEYFKYMLCDLQEKCCVDSYDEDNHIVGYAEKFSDDVRLLNLW